MQSLPLYRFCLFSMLLNGDIVDIEKPGEICSPTFVVDDDSRLSINQYFLSSINLFY